LKKQEAAPVETCVWPLNIARSMHEFVLCNEPVVPGHSLCRKHLSAIPRKRL
jgi:hypothetical protein